MEKWFENIVNKIDINSIRNALKGYDESDFQRRLAELNNVNFEFWKHDDKQLTIYLLCMLMDLNNLAKASPHFDGFQRKQMCTFIADVYNGYGAVNFHNFKHCFMVSQMTYILIKMVIKKCENFPKFDLLCLLLAAMCHDLNHEGFTNDFYKMAQRKHKAEKDFEGKNIKASGDSYLEKIHAEEARKILFRETGSLFGQDFPKADKIINHLIMRTDIKKYHNSAVDDFNQLFNAGRNKFDVSNENHRLALMTLIIKVADLGNEARPFKVHQCWLRCLVREMQGEKNELPGKVSAGVSSVLDDTKHHGQKFFIEIFTKKMAESLAKYLTDVSGEICLNINRTLEHYRKLSNEE